MLILPYIPHIIIMKALAAVLILILCICSQAKVVIQNLNDDFTPKDQLDYVNYLKLILGRQDVSTKLSDSLVELNSNRRYSSENSVRRVVIAFVPFASDDDKQHKSESSKEIELKGRLLQELIFETPQLFIVTNLPASEERRIHQLMEAYAAQRKVVHVIRGEAKEVARLGNMMNMESPEYEGRIKHPSNPTRRLSEEH